MSARTLDFYFDYLSPYAYLAWFNLKPLLKKHDLQLKPHPVLFAGFLNHWEHKGPAEILPKKVFTFKDCVRKADGAGISFFPPPVHPFNPLPALRLSLEAVCGPKQVSVIDSFWGAIWGQGKDGGSTEVLSEVLNRNGHAGEDLLKKIAHPEIKSALRKETEDAIAKGVFGVPTMIVEGELFWGNDQMIHIDNYLVGEDPILGRNMQEILSRPEGVRRSIKPVKTKRN